MTTRRRRCCSATCRAACKASRVLVNIFGGKRKNMTLGFPADLDKVALSEAFADAFYGNDKLIAPKLVEDGPVFENVMQGDDDRPRSLPDAALARKGRRPLYRHRLLPRHPRPRDGLDQSRLLPRHDQGQAHGQPQRAAGPARRSALQEIPRARRAHAGGDRRRRRPADLHHGRRRRAGGRLANTTSPAGCAASRSRSCPAR